MAEAVDRGSVESTEGVPRWTRLAALGLFLAALGPLLMVLAALAWGLEETLDDAGFFLITGAIGLVGAFLVWRFGTWSKIVGILAALLVGMALFWTAFGLFAPNSFFDFVPGVLVLPGVILAIACCIAAIVATRRGHYTASAQGGERRGISIVLTVVAVLAALSAVLTFTTKESVDAADADIEVTLSDFEFDDSGYSVAGGSQVYVRNDDPFLHTFTISELDIDLALPPGSEGLVEIPDEPGEYTVFCKPHTFDQDDPDLEDDMAASFTVE